MVGFWFGTERFDAHDDFAVRLTGFADDAEIGAHARMLVVSVDYNHECLCPRNRRSPDRDQSGVAQFLFEGRSPSAPDLPTIGRRQAIRHWPAATPARCGIVSRRRSLANVLALPAAARGFSLFFCPSPFRQYRITGLRQKNNEKPNAKRKEIFAFQIWHIWNAKISFLIYTQILRAARAVHSPEKRRRSAESRRARRGAARA
jgi:hypothetical protein